MKPQFSTIRSFFFSIVLSLVFTNGFSQLAGTYTIGGGGDYTTFNAAVTDLIAQGISAPVLFNVANGTYNEQVTIPLIAGVNASDTILFQSTNQDSSLVTMEFNADTLTNFIVRLNGAKHISFKHITLKALDNFVTRVIEISGGSHYNRFMNNRIEGPSSSSISNLRALVHSPSDVDSNNLFINNYFNKGTFAFNLKGTDASNLEVGTVIRGNSINGFGYRAVHLSFQKGPVVSENYINSTDGTCYAFEFVTDSSIILTKNEVIIPNNIGTAIYMNAVDGSLANPCEVSNNMVVTGGTAGTTLGLVTFGCDYVNIYHNSIYTDGTSASGAAIKLSGSNNNIQNNLFINVGGGYAASMFPSAVATMDNNCLFTTGANIGRWNNVDQATFANWKAASSKDASSVNVDPIFASTTNLRLTGFSPDTLQYGANLIASIPDDIEGEARPVSPTMGADQYICLLSSSIASFNHLTCNGGGDGDATASYAGGTSPFTFLWDDPSAQTNLAATGLDAGTHTFMVTDTKLCFDTAIITLTEPVAVYIVDAPQTICDNDSALIYGTYEKLAGTYYDSLLTVVDGCDSVHATVLNVDPTYSIDDGSAAICDNDSVLLYGSYQNTAGTYYSLNVPSVDGCDSLHFTVLTVNPTFTAGDAPISICDNDSALIYGIYQTVGGTYFDSLTSMDGCDSVRSTVLTVNPTYAFADPSAVICDGDSLLIYGAFRKVAGTYFDSLASIDGCDSVRSKVLAVNSIYNIADAPKSICSGDSTLIYGTFRLTAATYYDTLSSVDGCDSIRSTVLTVDPIYNTADAPISICSGDSVLLYGTYQMTAATYYDSLTSVDGCDSIHSTVLTVNPIYANVDAPIAICSGDSALIYGSYQLTAATYYDSLTSVAGCDSVHSTVLTINPVYAIVDAPIAICSGDSALIYGMYQLTAATYFNSLTSVDGCDSIRSTELSVDPVYTIVDAPIAICSGDSTQIYGTYQLTAATYYDSLTSVDGCDSIHSTALTVNSIYANVDVPISICSGDSVLIYGTYQLTAATYYDSLTSVAGCDSVYSTVLTVNPVYAIGDAPIAICSGDSALIYGMYQLTAATYFDSLTSVDGCDSIRSTELSVDPVYTIVDAPIAICSGDSTQIYGTYQLTAATYYDSLTSVAGCDSVHSTVLTLDATYNLVDAPVSVCAGDSVLIYGVYRTVSATYYDSLTTVAGCDSVHFTVLTVNSIPALTISDTTNVLCSGGSSGSITITPSGALVPYSYNWNDPSSQTDSIANGLTVGMYQVIVTDANGCIDSTSVTLTEPAVLIAAILFESAVLCNGGNDGFAVASGTGGTMPYSYLWDDPGTQTSDTATTLLFGNYEALLIDANGCMDSAVAIISEPLLMTLNIAAQGNVLCNGDSSGFVSVMASGGLGSYSYLWDDPAAQITPTASNLVAGLYSVTVSDGNNCAALTSLAITEPVALSSSLVITDASCNAYTDGQVALTVNGGIGLYTYAWDDDSSQTTSIAIGLTAGLYTVMINDSNGCTLSDTATIVEPLAISIGFSSSNSTCGNSDGSVSVAVSNGVGPLTYLWDDSGTQTTSTAIALASGIYTITVTDSIGCYELGTGSINDAGAATLTVDSIQNLSCNGDSIGAIYVSAIGGTAPYTYLWNDPAAQTSISAISLVAGNYFLMMTDSNNCTSTVADTVMEPNAITIGVAVTGTSCFGVCDGLVSAIVTGGVSPYTYLWSDPSGQTNAVASALCDSLYTVQVDDANGCIQSAVATVVEPSLLTLGISSNDISCNGLCNGQATVSVSGGSMPYTYLWDDPFAQATASAFNVCAGNYVAVVVDNNGCIDSLNTTVIEPSLLSVGLTGTDVLCNSDSNGSAAAFPTGGTMPYSYSWDDIDSQTTAVASGLSLGTYAVVVTDSMGCSASLAVVISEPALLSSSASQIDPLCGGVCDGSATVAVLGGTVPYYYVWNDPASQTGAGATGLCGGSYVVQVTDSNGCMLSDSLSLTNPTAMTASMVFIDPLCGGGCDGSATVTVGGGIAPFVYAWNDPTTQSTATAAGLCVGNYSVQVADSNGCSVSDSAVLSAPNPVSIILSSTPDTNSAGVGVATASVTGGTPPYTFVWSPASGSGSVATGLSMGTYNVTATDINGCTQSNVINVGNENTIGLSSSSRLVPNVSIYPNPNSGLFNLEVEALNGGNTLIEIYDNTGQLIHEEGLLGNSASTAKLIDLSMHSSGVYLVRVTNGNYVKTVRLSIQQ